MPRGVMFKMVETCGEIKFINFADLGREVIMYINWLSDVVVEKKYGVARGAWP
jgi:hypothetical protein